MPFIAIVITVSLLFLSYPPPPPPPPFCLNNYHQAEAAESQRLRHQLTDRVAIEGDLITITTPSLPSHVY